MRCPPVALRRACLPDRAGPNRSRAPRSSPRSPSMLRSRAAHPARQGAPGNGASGRWLGPLAGLLPALKLGRTEANDPARRDVFGRRTDLRLVVGVRLEPRMLRRRRYRYCFRSCGRGHEANYTWHRSGSPRAALAPARSWKTGPVRVASGEAPRRLAVGERRLCPETGLPRATIARALAGLPVRRGTALTIHAALALLDDDGADLRKTDGRRR